MINHKTLETYKEKIESALKDVRARTEQIEDELEQLKKQDIYIAGQVYAVSQLMEIKDNQHEIDLPLAGDKIEEEFAKRLEAGGFEDPEELYKARQEKSYLREAMDIVEDLDATNRTLAEGDVSKEGN